MSGLSCRNWQFRAAPADCGLPSHSAVAINEIEARNSGGTEGAMTKESVDEIERAGQLFRLLHVVFILAVIAVAFVGVTHIEHVSPFAAALR